MFKLLAQLRGLFMQAVEAFKWKFLEHSKAVHCADVLKKRTLTKVGARKSQIHAFCFVWAWALGAGRLTSN